KLGLELALHRHHRPLDLLAKGADRLVRLDLHRGTLDHRVYAGERHQRFLKRLHLRRASGIQLRCAHQDSPPVIVAGLRARSSSARFISPFSSTSSYTPRPEWSASVATSAHFS